VKPLKALGALLAAATLTSALAASAATATAAPAPAWSIQSLAAPTNFKPGDESGLDSYQVHITNSGGEVTDHSPIKILDTLPKGLIVKSITLNPPRLTLANIGKAPACESSTVAEATTVSCEVTDALLPVAEPATLYPGDELMLVISVATPPSAIGTLENEVQVEGGGAQAATRVVENEASAKDAAAGFAEFHTELTGSDGNPVNAAASHPFDYTTSFALKVNPSPPGAAFRLEPAEGDPKNIEVALPPGLIGNPTAVSQCTAQEFNTVHTASSPTIITAFLNECPASSVVGLAMVQQLDGEVFKDKTPLFNLVPPKGMPAQFGFRPSIGVPVYINTKVRSDGDYGITAYLHNVTEAAKVTASRVTIWGTPWDHSHDTQRGECANLGEGSCSPNATPVRPFLRLPSSCADPLLSGMSFETWSRPAVFSAASSLEPAPTACDQPDFSPTIEARPTTNVADAPSGLHFDLHLPQAAHEEPEGLGEADLRDATVTLPPGFVVNPSSADGLGACSLSEIGYQGFEEGHPSFSGSPANCPDAARIGTVKVDTPLLDHPLEGAVYLAKQRENPFQSLLAIYIDVEDPQTGVVVKLAGKVTPDPLTGQLTTTVSDSPQLPFEDFTFDFFKGARAPLRSPNTCTSHTTTTMMVPWSSPEGAAARPADSFAIAQAPGGGACAAAPAGLPHAPTFEAGTADPVAGAYSPFVLRLKREDGSQELKGLNVSLPEGLSARLAGTAECPEGAIAQAREREVPGRGASEQASASCPASSLLGTVTVGAGAGPAPFYVQGKAYLAGPYRGAPLSMVIVTPAVAGPFDLGAVVVRAALRVDPETAKVTVVSDPLPTILQGIPLDVRSIAVRIDRPTFILNPTSCEAKSLTAEAISTSGQVAQLANHFEVGDCASLGFRPKLSLKLKGKTKRTGHPALTATLTYPSQGAYSNVAMAAVALPHSEFLEQSHIRTICTRVQFAADQCPPGSIYGRARAITPLLDKPLEGPVYLRSSSHPLPDLVAALDGQVDVVLVGRVDSVRGGIRTSFEAVPDAPVSSFTLSLPAGKKSLLVNSTDICKGKHRATATFTAQNGKVLQLRPRLNAGCRGGNHDGHKGSKGRGHHRHARS
jgi:hypothetical protein